MNTSAESEPNLDIPTSDDFAGAAMLDLEDRLYLWGKKLYGENEVKNIGATAFAQEEDFGIDSHVGRMGRVEYDDGSIDLLFEFFTGHELLEDGQTLLRKRVISLSVEPLNHQLRFVVGHSISEEEVVTSEEQPGTEPESGEFMNYNVSLNELGVPVFTDANKVDQTITDDDMAAITAIVDAITGGEATVVKHDA